VSLFLLACNLTLTISPLLAAKFVRSMSKTLPNRVCLYDTRTENGQVLKVALNIIYTNSITSETIQEDSNIIKYVIEFAKDWNISMIPHVIQTQLKKDIDSGSEVPSLFNQFLIALNLGDNALAAQYYAAPVRAEWSGERNSDGGSGIGGNDKIMDDKEDTDEEKDEDVDQDSGDEAGYSEDEEDSSGDEDEHSENQQPEEDESIDSTDKEEKVRYFSSIRSGG